MDQSRKSTLKYVYDIPYFERMELCRILDQNDKWEELGGIYMNFDVLTIQTLRREILRGNSPTDELLTKWGHQNHTILELFVLLSKMQHYQAMLIIKQFVNPEYHRLIYEGEQNLNRLFLSKENSKSQASNSWNQKILNSSLPGEVCPNQESENKILNRPQQSPSATGNSTSRNNAQTILVNRTINELPSEPKQLPPKFLKPDSTKDKNISEISSIAESVGILPVITFKELEIATNGWNHSTILGRGGFGTVYRGTWKNTSVAIKRTKNSETDENHSVQIQQILGELKMLNSYRHDNILPLYGFSMDGEDPCLIYQFMPNGSLEDRLLCRQNTKSLSWQQRLNIATGTARGIQFLHTIGEKPLIHGDIKSANILLDSNFEPKIGDFGLAREGPYNHYTHMKVSRVHGTRPYLPDEFLRHKKFSTKVDTHSFGIVLFELGTGLRAYDDQRLHKFLKDLIENTSPSQLINLIDKKCGIDDVQTFSNLIALGKCCVSRKPKDRPEMVVVLQELNTLTTKKDMLAKGQTTARQSSYTPTIPHEMQAFQDYLSQQKKISPSSSNATNFRAPTRALSPILPSPQLIFPDPNIVGNAASLEAQVGVNMNLQNHHNPFIQIDLKKNLLIKDDKLSSPGTSNEGSANVENKTAFKEVIGKDVQCKTPVISVSPPSASQNSISSSEDDETAEPSSKSQVNEDVDYEYMSDIENFLPLISVLGVKGKSEERKDETVTSSVNENKENNDISTSAKGKPLWILNDSS